MTHDDILDRLDELDASARRSPKEARRVISEYDQLVETLHYLHELEGQGRLTPTDRWTFHA